MLNNDLSYEAGIRVQQCEQFAEERLNREAPPLWRRLSALPDPLECEGLRPLEEPYLECAREMLYAYSRELPGPSGLMHKRLRKRIDRIVIMVVDRWKQHRDARFGGRYCCESFDLKHLETWLTDELTRIADAVVDTIAAAEENRYGPGHLPAVDLLNMDVTEEAPHAPAELANRVPEANRGTTSDSTGAPRTSDAAPPQTAFARVERVSEAAEPKPGHPEARKIRVEQWKRSTGKRTVDLYQEANVHKQDFYDWLKGEHADSSVLSERLARVLDSTSARPPSTQPHSSDTF